MMNVEATSAAIPSPERKVESLLNLLTTFNGDFEEVTSRITSALHRLTGEQISDSAGPQPELDGEMARMQQAAESSRDILSRLDQASHLLSNI